MEHVAFTIFNPINRVLGLGQIINVATVGKAMHKVAEDASIKPAAATNIKKSVFGSLVYSFPNANIEEIGSQK